jgi:predicted ATPase/DNA-binding SARP family transcriptional activator
VTELLHLRLLGRPEVRLGNVVVTEALAAKAQAILYYLAVTDPSGQPRSVLASLLWGDAPEAAARASLRKALANLRQTLGEFLDLDGQTIGFKPDRPYAVDVVEFVEKAAGVASASAVLQLQEAVALYRGDFLAGFYVREALDFENWMLAEQARLRELVIQALHTLAAYHAGQGELAQGIGSLRRLLNLEPWREEAHRQLMLLLAQDGQRSVALAQYENCRQALARELGVEPGRETVALYEQIRAGELSREPTLMGGFVEEQGSRGESFTPAPFLPGPSAPSLNLPPQPTSFVGREKELASIIRRLTDRDCRLLTLVGPGGIGKTRLALQTAQSFIDSGTGIDFFAQGIVFVPLAGVSSIGGMVSAIAEAVNFTFYSHGPPRQQLLNYLRGKNMLLVLDNLEHLLDGGDALISEILAVAPQVKILVTSREALNLREAWFHPVEGMSFPPTRLQPLQETEVGYELGTTSLEKYDAVQLFMQSASRVRVEFSLAAEQAQVVRICQLVEGMPLAVELAATWLKVLPTAEIVREIENNLDILSTRLQNLPERHRSMRAVFEQSWLLLMQKERNTLKRLSVFRGGFDQPAAEQVAGATLITLAILVEKSLLRVTARGQYHMHELLRQFAAEKLAASWEEGSSTYERHSAYYLEFLKKREQRLAGKEQRQALDEISQEIDNIRTAWYWAIAQHSLEIIHQTADSLYDFYQIRSRYQEGQELFASAISPLRQADAPAGQPKLNLVHSRLEARLGAFCYFLGDYEAASQHLQASLQTTNSPAELAFVHRVLGNMARLQGQRATAEEQLGQSLAISREIGDLNGVLEALLGLTDVAGSFGEYDVGEQRASESLAISRQLERPDKVAQALSALAWSTSCLGAYDEAEAYYKESLAICQEIGNQSGFALALEHVGWIAWCIGGARLVEATGYYEKAVAIYREIGERSRLSMCLADLALTLNDLGAYEKAQQHSLEGLAITEATGNLGLRSYNLCCLGVAAGGLGDFQASRKYLLKSLQIAWEAQIPDNTLNTLYYLAMLSVQESVATDLPEPVKLRYKARALELLTLVVHHPATWQAIKDRAARLQLDLEVELAADVTALAKAQGRSKTLKAVVTEILEEV